MIPDFKTAEDRSQWIINHADLWTAIRFIGRGRYDRYEFTDRQSAEKAAQTYANQNGGRYLIYACAGIYDTYVSVVMPQ